MVQTFIIFLVALTLAAIPATAQDQTTRPAAVDKPEIHKNLPKDVKSLHIDGGPKIFKDQVDKPIGGKNTNTGPGGSGAQYEKPTGSSVQSLTTGDSSSGPGDQFKKKQKVLSGKNTRGTSDEGGDLEDLEIQR